MTREEYEERRRSFEEQHRAEIALLNAAHEVRIRSLERLWQEALGREERPAAAEAPPAPVQPAPAAKSVRPRYSVFQDLEEALPRLPDVFDRQDIDRVLGYESARTTLFRAVQRLRDQGAIAIEAASSGGALVRYRKLK